MLSSRAALQPNDLNAGELARLPRCWTKCGAHRQTGGNSERNGRVFLILKQLTVNRDHLSTLSFFNRINGSAIAAT
jgi:hypothetical protein